MPNEGGIDALVERVYDIAVAPERLERLIDSWNSELNGGLSKELGLFAKPGLAGHIARAEQILNELTAINGHGRRNAHDWADASRTAALVVNRDGKIVAVNAAARDGLRLGTGKSLKSFPALAEDVALLWDIVTGPGSGVRGHELLRLRQRGEGSPVLVRIVELVCGNPEHIGLVTSFLSWPPNLTQQLQSTFKLTDAEAQVLKELTLGFSVKDIATRSGRSEPTIRSHVQAILHKTGTRSQIEFVRVTLGMLEAADPAPLIAPVSGPPGVNPEPNHYETLVLACGRRLDYLAIGAPQGRPFLMLPSDGGFTRLPPVAEAWLAANDLTMIVPVRAGYGHSSPLPKGRDAFEVAIADMEELCDHLGMERCPILSTCDDFHLAVSFACAAPERVSAIIALGPTMPATEPKHFKRMPKWTRFVFANARYAPRALPFVGLAIFQFMRRIGPRRFMETVLAESKADQDALKDDAILTAMLGGSEICVGPRFTAHVAWAKGAEANYAVDWSAKLAACPVPMILYAGREDPFAPIETTREFAADTPNITLREYPGRGQLMYPEWPSFLAEIARFAKADALSSSPRNS